MGHHSEQPFEQKSSNYRSLPRVPLTVDIVKNLSGQQNVLVAHQVQMQLDINKYSIQNLGYILPFIVELNISNSLLDSIRDLGTCLRNLKILRVSNCRLENLDGATGLIGLLELEARDNYIDDVYNCAFLPKLEILDIENNNVSDVNNLSFLSVCNNLQKLTLRDNPVAEETEYRENVWTRVPKLKILDDIVLTKRKVDNGNIILYNSAVKIEKGKESEPIKEQTLETEEEQQARSSQKNVEKERLKKKKLQRRPTLSDLVEKQRNFSTFWPTAINKPLFLRRRRTNSMVDEILYPIENDEKEQEPTIPANKTLTKQNSMPDYPAWFDPYLSINEGKSIDNTNNQQLNDTPLTYTFKSNTCLVHDSTENKNNVKTIFPSPSDETISLVTLMSTRKFPKPVQKGDSLEFSDSE